MRKQILRKSLRRRAIGRISRDILGRPHGIKLHSIVTVVVAVIDSWQLKLLKAKNELGQRLVEPLSSRHRHPVPITATATATIARAGPPGAVAQTFTSK
jgi:hypothetical protein